MIGENMTREELKIELKNNQYICAIKDSEGLEKCINSDYKVVFVLYGTVMNICEIVKVLKDAGKITFVHIDLIEGLSAKEVAVEFIADNTGADGIISTKQTLIKIAAVHGLLTVQRFFLIDSLAYSNLLKQIKSEAMDVIEVLPACSTKTISKIVKITELPVIASGLIQDNEDVAAALSAGATAISGTNFDFK
jgi:glycerol-3-phosphate responsive antiterminator